MRIHPARILGAAVVVLTLAGCAPTAGADPAPSPTPSAAPVETPSETPTPMPEPVVIDPADVSTWVISGQGIGPLTRGAAYPDVIAPLTSYTADEWCPGIVGLVGEDAPGFTLALNDDRTVRALWVSSAVDPALPVPATESGIRVGSTKAELDAAYPALEVAGQIAQETFVFAAGDDVNGWVDFTVIGDEVSMIGVSSTPIAPKELCG
ncbi:hypothetical protein [Agromyces aureus]|uniref:DUF306 domain-containing protein n=1 Tax=Agromyces aureus TaxID=453304 RepID=A0A191WC72_9MICO|nr:hypothetical protein [Agromyces aureus]ANJ25860.1 hypothetical protein ATC03_02960 [Agromyces aureus]